MELEDYLRALRPHWWAILLITLLGTGIGYGWTLVQDEVFQADVTGVVQPIGTEGVNEEIIAQNLAMSKVVAYVEYGSSRSVAERAIESLDLATSPEALVQRVSVTNPLDTAIIKVTASAGTPVQARDLANAWLAGMVAEINEIEGGTGETTDAAPTGSTAVLALVPIDSARLASTPSFPNVRLTLALGALIGLALGVAYALVRHTLDRRIRSAETVEQLTGVPVVGRIPLNHDFTADNHIVPLTTAQRRDAEGRRHSRDDAATAEALRELRTNLQFMDVDNPPRVIVVTSPAPGDGKSTITANLAITIAASGQNVVLVDADLRRPTVSAMFGLPAGGGLSDVLAGRAALDDVMHRWVGADSMRILTAGNIPPNPSEVLGSARMMALIAQLAENAMVIIDAPPLLAVTDAAVLTGRADGAFVVVSAGKTTFDALTNALNILNRSKGRTMGVILNRVPRRGLGSDRYDYRYTYQSGPALTAQSVDDLTLIEPDSALTGQDFAALLGEGDDPPRPAGRRRL
ncbi:polysaccharide biosynthesis tyrosine autokinase [Cryobacterium sp. SO2]|uniref:polysaccharide biosynthesis tyrosine autokinase n=1 Tax=Cryobacterium sp. SO2 TaxID=1897060 RepID=UPI00223D002A|nr:polysaccharide biosynthesis tyrosine autokinase [Cryobacterium sp. SO2]WEO78034.1 polysaccharide biosynthesis tyrosine autokinase [Cryobacterium sp. SO2]